MQLINTYAVLAGESGSGWYRRLACDNALRSWKELAKACEVSVSRSGLLLRPQHVAAKLGLDEAWCRRASAQHEVTTGWRGLHRGSRDAVCPYCLREKGYIRAFWEHVYAVACPRHELVLWDRCDACGEPLSANRECIEQCDCGHDLRYLPARRATHGQLWVASLIESNGASSGKWAPQVSGVAVDVAAMLVRTLCSMHDPRAPAPRQNSCRPRTIDEAVTFLRPLDELLASWPTAFEAHVSQRIAAGHPEARTLNSLLGKWYLQLKSYAGEDASGSPLVEFLDAVGRVAAAEFNGLVGLDSAAGVLAKHGMHILANQAARRIGIHRDTLVSRIKSGQVQHRTKKFGTRGLAYEVPAEEVERIVTARAGWVSEPAAGELLGVPVSVVMRLAEAGLLTSDAQWRKDVRKGGAIELTSVHQLIARLRGVEAESAGGRRIALSALTGRRVGDKRAILDAMRAIAAGQIRPVAQGRLVGATEYPLCEVAKFYSRPVLDAGLSVQALAKLSGWKWESISHWVELGLLDASSIMVRGQLCRVVSPAQLLQFCRTYMPLADLAKAFGSKSCAITDRLPGVEVVGSKLLPGGSHRGGLVRLTDVLRAALSHEHSHSHSVKREV